MKKHPMISFAAIGSLIAAGVASAFSSDAPAREPSKKRPDKPPHEFKPRDIDPFDKPRSKRARRRAAGKARAASPSRALTREEQQEQGQRCGCLGTNESCPCQNHPDPITQEKWGQE